MRASAALRFLLPTLGLGLAACSGAGGDHQSGDGLAESTGESEAALTEVCGATTGGAVQGYDVSYYQGSFNWAGTGVQFGAARISDGTGFIDPDFDANWANMKSAGVIRGAYQFFEPGQDEVAQANLVIAKVGKLGANELPVQFDVEVTGGQSPATIRAKAQHWLDLVEAGTGKRPFVYSYGSFLETNLGSGFGKYPLWIANYGATCPSVPNGWTNWVIWQYSDGSGKLDHDVYNGSLAQLQALASGDSTVGYLDSATCTGIAGWSQDPSAPTASINVDVYVDGQAGDPKATGFRVDASIPRADVAKAVGSANHGFTSTIPLSLFDTQTHPVYAYGIATTTGGTNALLVGAPRSLECPLAAIPIAPAQGVKRHVPSPAVLTAWKLSTFWSLSPQTPATVASYAAGDDLPATPEVVQGDDGSPSVYVLDGAKKRHVVSMTSLQAWNFTATKMNAAKLDAIPSGPDWAASPFMVQGTGDPAVYVIDMLPSTPPGAAPTGSGDGGVGSSSSSADAAGGGHSDSGGCSVGNVGTTRTGSLAIFGLAFALVAAMRRRRAI